VTFEPTDQVVDRVQAAMLEAWAKHKARQPQLPTGLEPFAAFCSGYAAGYEIGCDEVSKRVEDWTKDMAERLKAGHL
jgi:hypothetical protein